LPIEGGGECQPPKLAILTTPGDGNAVDGNAVDRQNDTLADGYSPFCVVAVCLRSNNSVNQLTMAFRVSASSSVV
jgi:hypothetical protein